MACMPQGYGCMINCSMHVSCTSGINLLIDAEMNLQNALRSFLADVHGVCITIHIMHVLLCRIRERVYGACMRLELVYHNTRKLPFCSCYSCNPQKKGAALLDRKKERVSEPRDRPLPSLVSLGGSESTRAPLRHRFRDFDIGAVCSPHNYFIERAFYTTERDTRYDTPQEC